MYFVVSGYMSFDKCKELCIDYNPDMGQSIMSKNSSVVLNKVLDEVHAEELCPVLPVPQYFMSHLVVIKLLCE